MADPRPKDSMREAPAFVLPPSIGVGYKPQHFVNIVDDAHPIEWLEIHAENYMSGGGRPLAQLRHLAERFPISVHGVGLSIGGETALDEDHLARLKTLCTWVHPSSFSEHLAWSTHDGVFFNDLLPLPYTQETLSRVSDHVDRVQEVLGRRMLLENPSSYLAFAETEMSEVEFLTQVARRTGCGLLLDVNNVYVSGCNLGFAPAGFIDAFPMDLVGEVHLGGHSVDRDTQGASVLIDSHSQQVADTVWGLFAEVIARSGPVPTLIEWDNDVPDWAVLVAEATRATAAMKRPS